MSPSGCGAERGPPRRCGCVRRCQGAVEPALKALLRAVGAEVPKVHDVSGELRQNVDRLLPAAAAEIDTPASPSRRLREERERSDIFEASVGIRWQFARAALVSAMRSCR